MGERRGEMEGKSRKGERGEGEGRNGRELGGKGERGEGRGRDGEKEVLV